jgi:hypothetical protein
MKKPKKNIKCAIQYDGVLKIRSSSPKLGTMEQVAAALFSTPVFGDMNQATGLKK